MSLRLFVPTTLIEGAELDLPPAAARHAQVRRVQPGDTVLLFDGSGQDWPALVLQMGRQHVHVRVLAAVPVHRELPWAVTVALVVPANERMDYLVEKATELGVSIVQPLLSERSVLRLDGERAQRKREHWQGVAVAACEQCGRSRVPQVAPLLNWGAWLQALAGAPQQRWLLSLQPAAVPWAAAVAESLAPGAEPSQPLSLCTLSGPEGGLTEAEEHQARSAGFVAVRLGPRVLRAETAPLAVLAWLSLHSTTRL